MASLKNQCDSISKNLDIDGANTDEAHLHRVVGQSKISNPTGGTQPSFIMEGIALTSNGVSMII
jgi:hypothetical protein